MVEFNICKGCGVPVRWVVTEKKQSMICEAEPMLTNSVPDGVTAVTSGGRVVKGPCQLATGESAYITHWARCPDADKFRRRRS